MYRESVCERISASEVVRCCRFAIADVPCHAMHDVTYPRPPCRKIAEFDAPLKPKARHDMIQRSRRLASSLAETPNAKPGRKVTRLDNGDRPSSPKNPVQHLQRSHVLAKSQFLARYVLWPICFARRSTRTSTAGPAAAVIAPSVYSLGGGFVHKSADAGDRFDGGFGV